jgi:hypothetical protein
MVALGYGKYVRAADIVAVIPIEDDQRGEGRRTYVHVAGIDGPIVASRSERAILTDMALVPNAGTHAPAGEDRVRGARRWRRPRERREGHA